MGWFSKVTRAVGKGVSTVGKVATTPNRIVARAASKVLPRSVGRVLTKAAGFNPGSFVVGRALSKLAPSRRPPAAPSASRGFGFAPSLTAMRNMLTQPTASPSSGQMLSPAAVQAVAASVQPSAGFSTSWGGGGGGGGGEGGDEDAGGAYDEGNDAGGAYGGESDPTEEMPDEFFDSRDDDGSADLGGIDYHAALGGLGDWKGELATFGKAAALNVGKAAITTIGNKLTASGKPIPPPVSTGIPMAAKVAAGAVVALGVGYALTRRSGASV